MDISVAVISYNSEKTILHTLESVLHQTYSAKKIELIISDDASSDRTVDVIKEWVSLNRLNFKSVTIIEGNSNNGVSHNCNAAWMSCSCDWIKTIAADDILKENCLETNFEYVNKNPSCQIVFSYMEWFGSVNKITPTSSEINFFNLPPKKQNKVLKYFSFNVAPTSFVKKELLENVGFADERFRLFEDLPLWIKITDSGVPLHFNPEVTVFYRVGDSISKSSINLINKEFLKDCLALNIKVKSEKFPSSGFFLKYEELFILRYKIFLSYIFSNKKTPLSLFLSKLVWVLVPLNSFYRTKKRMLLLQGKFMKDRSARGG